MSHPLEEIPTGVDLELPVRRLLLAGVETGNPCQVIDKVRPDRRIYLHLWGEVGIHLLLHESGMEVAGIGDDQTDIGHFPLNGRAIWGRGCRAERRQRG